MGKSLFRCLIYSALAGREPLAPAVLAVVDILSGSQTNNKDGQPIAHSANVNKACHATQAAKSRDLWQEMCHVVRYDSK